MRLCIEIISPGEHDPNSEPVKSSTGPKPHHLAQVFTCLICQYQHGGSEPRLHRSLAYSRSPGRKENSQPCYRTSLGEVSNSHRKCLSSSSCFGVIWVVWRCRRRIKQMDTADSCWPQITHPSDQSKWWSDELLVVLHFSYRLYIVCLYSVFD